jgi:hypothetical protein
MSIVGISSMNMGWVKFISQPPFRDNSSNAHNADLYGVHKRAVKITKDSFDGKAENESMPGRSLPKCKF